MIKTENGSVQMMGNLAEIMTDMTLVIKAFRSGISKNMEKKQRMIFFVSASKQVSCQMKN